MLNFEGINLSLSSQDNLGLEEDCDWGVPLLKKPAEQVSTKPPLNLDGLRCRRESEVSMCVCMYRHVCVCVLVHYIMCVCDEADMTIDR